MKNNLIIFTATAWVTRGLFLKDLATALWGRCGGCFDIVI